MRNLFKFVGIVILLLVVLLVAWNRMPVSIIYYKEIEMGNKFAENIKNYKQQFGKFPKEDDWQTLSKLNSWRPNGEYQEWYPEFKVVDSVNFSLTYIEGFDPPYLSFDTKSNTWEMRFNE